MRSRPKEIMTQITYSVKGLWR